MQYITKYPMIYTHTPMKTEKAPVVYDCAPDLEDKGACAVDPCEADKCFPEPRVVIIGAGMAGLSAAARLSQRGINNIVVLEAYERPGGRIHSCWLGDIVAELGSHWKPDNCFTHPVYMMSATESPPQPGIPGSEHTRGLFNRIVTGKMPFPPTITAYHKFRQIEEEAAQIYCLGGNKQQGSLIHFMSMRIQQELHEYPEEQQHDAARIMFGLTHMISARYGDDTSMLCADHFGCFMNMPGGEVRVPLGLVGILAPLLRQIPEGAIRYCKPVNCIYWGTSQKSGYRATVCTTDGEEFPADYVIITVSLGVLVANSVKMFCPALPASKIDAMRCLGFGFCNKIYLEYCRPFWFWHKGNLSFKYCHELFGRCDWTRGIKAIEEVPNSKHVMCTWVVGQEAMMMEGLCDKDVAEGITDVLRFSTGNPYIPYPVTILRSHWTSDPFFRGAYSYDSYCADGTAQRALACPLPGPSDPIPPILLFAGEATIPGHLATVSGARLSGIREAERIVQLTVQFKGPPLPLAKLSVPKNLKNCEAEN
ncbi:peroxisomal N(1)-acetyl-spermine/spermidine oxidase-like isoform X2 [Achroia grisella]|uniref:peroxisomal N(1)-acetyl-spermine/spermidine oxidase-like isoform X2 n=1 Tax=Achroia grisella TaxID=688607 RepID=UPI0027D25F2A|nr:peroxisomal N(1)-acetyl-spermine/spermidine oxidase-like isoform X2 [Achroia grisella]